MIGMNAEDSLGLLEDVQALGLLHRRRTAAFTGPSAQERLADRRVDNLRDEVLQATTREIGTNKRLQRQTAEFATLAADYHDLAAVQRASKNVIEGLIGLVAQASGQSVESVRASTNVALSRAYDAQIDEALRSKKLAADPRKDPNVLSRPSRSWYTPGV